MVKEKCRKPVPYGFKISKDVIAVKDSDTIKRAARVLTGKNIGAVIVKSDGVMTGILSERDIVQRVVDKGLDPAAILVKEIMTRNVITVDIAEGLNKIHDELKRIHFRHLPVVKKGRVIGIVSNRDLMYLRKLKLRS